MKNKWIWWTLTILLTLIVLVGVGGAGFRLGFMQGRNNEQSKNGAPPFFADSQRFDNNFNERPRNQEQGFDHKHRREFNRGFQHGFRHGGLFFIFGLMRVAVLGLILWGGYTLYKRSGWQFVKVNATEAVSAEEVKPDRKKKK